MNSTPCTVCGEGGHSIRRCPTLYAPLTPGFYAPPAGHRPSGDDDEDEKLKATGVAYVQLLSLCLTSSSRSAMLSPIKSGMVKRAAGMVGF